MSAPDPTYPECYVCIFIINKKPSFYKDLPIKNGHAVDTCPACKEIHNLCYTWATLDGIAVHKCPHPVDFTSSNHD